MVFLKGSKITFIHKKKPTVNLLVGVITEACPLPAGYTVMVRSSQYCSQQCVVFKSTPHNNDKDLCLPQISPPVTRLFATEETSVSVDRNRF